MLWSGTAILSHRTTSLAGESMKFSTHMRQHLHFGFVLDHFGYSEFLSLLIWVIWCVMTFRVQLQKVLSQGYDDSAWPLQTKHGR